MRITITNLSVLARQAPAKLGRYAARLKRFFLLLPFLFLLIVGALYVILPFAVKPPAVEKVVAQKLGEVFENVSYDTFNFSYFPLLTAEFRNARFELDAGTLAADSIKIHLNPILVLIGRTDIAALEVRNAKPAGIFYSFDAAKIPFENLFFKISSVRPGAVMKFELQGDLSGKSRAFSGKGFLNLKDFRSLKWQDTALDFSLKLIPVGAQMMKETFAPGLPFQVKGGDFSGDVRFRKDRGSPLFYSEGRAGLKKFSYSVPEESIVVSSPEIDSELLFDFTWDPAREEIVLNRAAFRTPAGQVEMKGRSILGTGEVKETRIAVTGLSLETIPQYWLPFREAIPFNVGFSGLSDLEMSLEGTFDHLSLHANWDLTPALFTYARYFSKPKDFPLNLTFDFLLKEGKVLSGDFSARLKDCAFKGTVTNLNVRNGIGQVNILTNKFQLAGWEELLPPFEKYKIAGDTKLLANFTGNIRNLAQAGTILNWTLENGSFTSPGASEIQNAFVSLDYSPMLISVKHARFEIAHSPVTAEMAVYKPHDNPLAKIKIASPHFQPLTALDAAMTVGTTLSSSMNERIAGIRKAIEEFFPEGESFENFSAEAEYLENKWLLKRAQFEAYGGQARAQGTLDFNKTVDQGALTVEVDHLGLARFLERNGAEDAKILDGNFFLKGNFSGNASMVQDWRNFWSGDGTFSVTNGEFHTFDLLGTIGQIDELKAVVPAVTGTTPFDDVHSEFVFREGEFVMENLELVSRNLAARGEGDATLEGILNYRLEAFLSVPLTEEVLAAKNAEVQLKGRTQFGPIPILLTGPLSKPELRPDPAVVAQIVNQLLDGKFQKILSNFAPEESFFERRTSS